MEIPKKIYFKLRPKILPINNILSFIPYNSSILDLGCGKGLLVNYIKNFNSYTGVDLHVIKDNSRPKVRFLKRDCTEFVKEKINTYNTFLIIDLIHHIPRDKQFTFLNDVIMNSKPGDLIIIKDINPRGLIFKFWNSFHDLVIAKQVINYLDFEKFKNSLTHDIKIIDNYHKRVFLYDHYFLVLQKN